MTKTIAIAESIAIEHYEWLRSEGLTHREMYAAIDEDPPREYEGGDGVVQAIAAKWLGG